MRLIGLAIVAVVVLAFAPGAGAAAKFPSVNCDGVLPAGSYSRVTVEIGASCVAERGILITSTLSYSSNAHFTLGTESGGPSGVIGGGVNLATGAGGVTVQIHHAVITRGVEAGLAVGVNAITNSDITGNVTADHPDAGCLPFPAVRPASWRIANNTIHGNLRIVRAGKNGCHPMDSIVVSGNTITGNLDCGRTDFERNDPPVTLGGGPPNIVFGMKVGDCVGL